MMKCSSSSNKSLKQDKKQLVFAPSSLILTNYFLPLNEALCVKGNYVASRKYEKNTLAKFVLAFNVDIEYLFRVH